VAEATSFCEEELGLSLHEPKSLSVARRRVYDGNTILSSVDFVDILVMRIIRNLINLQQEVPGTSPPPHLS
jgi:hypothetical protein